MLINVISRRAFYEYVKCEKVAQTDRPKEEPHSPAYSLRDFLSFPSPVFIQTVFTWLHFTHESFMDILFRFLSFFSPDSFSWPPNLYLLCASRFCVLLLEGNYTRSIIIIHCQESKAEESLVLFNLSAFKVRACLARLALTQIMAN